MQTIGEKLEETRKRLGISIREASEVTKIRSEYLAGFENNSFDINLPEVYIRGFLRSYAQFLKLNSDKIITDYNAHKLGQNAFAPQRESRESLGRMDIAAAGAASEESARQPAAATIEDRRPQQPAASNVAADDRFSENSIDKAALLKGGGAIAAAAVAVVVVVIGLVAFLRSGANDATAEETAVSAPIATQELTLFANGGNIPLVIVTEIDTEQELFRGPLNDGDSQRVPFVRQVRLNYSKAEHLQIEHNGMRYEVGGRGPSRSTFPPNIAK